VTLDVGCYLIELALLAAYDHRRSIVSTETGKGSETLATTLHPDGIDATGHGIVYKMDSNTPWMLNLPSRFDGVVANTVFGMESVPMKIPSMMRTIGVKQLVSVEGHQDSETRRNTV
jgi:hypothetical protein